MKLIPLNTIMVKKSKKHGLFALVNDEDFDYLNQWKWSSHNNCTRTVYARRIDYSLNKKGKQILMHRLLMKVTNTKDYIDHIDGNGLNNQKENLRICTQTENQRNRKSNIGSTSKYVGVYLDKRAVNKKWIAEIGMNNKKFKKRFLTEIEAAKHYNSMAKILFGEFANINKFE